ncbi:hypothetical protein J3S22_07450 [Corynebacterium aurimucosum]|uniref:hypothetical protein n=1 Tax=Corynebacterium aurimucosum TaxID=169292 RepID=UPI00191F0FDD|nr:hypothetical protein [Corynebacterium aurimucosum]QQU96496.1 hypothetical protein I6I66_05265 [Corynebacterium aurimucosum]UTA70621.1 hypothetical protein J3S22_07450 [Corynebacterium aurimucosum]
MSIDMFFDEYLAERGLQRSAEVVPDHAFQVFSDIPESKARSSLDEAAQLVARALGE